MKRSVLLLSLLLTGSAAHAQYGGLLNAGLGAAADRMLNGVAKDGSQSEYELVATVQYNGRSFQKKRSLAPQRPLLNRKLLATLEQQLETCYQLLQKSETAPLLVGEHSAEAMQAIIRQLQFVGTTWGLSPYQNEIAFYQEEDLYRHGRGLELAAARAAHLRDSLQVAARQRTAAADPLLAASPTTAYLNAVSNSTLPLQTDPTEDGKTIGKVATGSLLSILYYSPETGQCYVCVDGVYGWMAAGNLVPTLSAANELRQQDVATHTKVRPGFVSLRLQQQPALEAVAPSALAGVVAARAAEKARAEAAYAKAHPEPVEAPVLNNLVYLDADQYLYLNSNDRVSVTYHVRASCPMLRGGKIKRMPYSRIDHVAAPIEMELCDECGYLHPGHRRAATASATRAKPAAATRATHAKPTAKTHK